MRSLLLIPCLALTSLLPAQAPKPAPTPPPPANGRVAGTVTLSDTHAPARGAMVYLRDAKREGSSFATSRFTHTDINGHFLFSKVPPGEYFLQAALEGYLSTVERRYAALADPPTSIKGIDKIIRDFGTITVHANSTTTADQTLDHGAALSGRVLYADGSPVIGATFYVEPKNRAAGEGRKGTNRFTSSHTDDHGRYREDGLGKGQYCVIIIPPRQDTPLAGEEEDYVSANTPASRIRFYSGNTFHLATAKLYDLSEGQEYQADDIIVPLGSLHSLSGSVSAVDGRTPNIGHLTLADASDPAVLFTASLSDDGAYNFGNIPPGTYNLKIDGAALGVPNITAAREWQREQLVAKDFFKDSSQSLVINDIDLTAINFALTPDPNHKPDPPKSDDDD